MTPKEKAKELLKNMSEQTYKIQPYAGARYVIEEIGYEAGKKCALIAVNEILLHEKENHCVLDKSTDYWQEVKQEIENL